ncbi:unnamed protein product [Blepharisma stoltei]|uniref:Uncharacterized protein n=1 Tax=Blepharisma stoltei TaxID=1481888 RepID=A0AAU9K1L1_9CILI|nr:unnamed protein product [Blepharisma stoltei]
MDFFAWFIFILIKIWSKAMLDIEIYVNLNMINSINILMLGSLYINKTAQFKTWFCNNNFIAQLKRKSKYFHLPFIKGFLIGRG